MTCERCGYEHPSEVGRTLEDALLRCIANLRADLAKARQEIETIDAFRAAPWSEIRKLLGDDDSLDEAIAGAVCATILTHRALAANKREAEERATQAEAQCAAMREAAAQAAETQPFYPDTHTGMRQQWVKAQIAAKIRALPPDAGCHLLTAMRRLMEAQRPLVTGSGHTLGCACADTVCVARAAALADPALAALQGAP